MYKKIIEELVEYANNNPGATQQLKLEEFTGCFPKLRLNEDEEWHYKTILSSNNRILCMQHNVCKTELELKERIEYAYHNILRDIFMTGIYGNKGLIELYKSLDKYKTL